MKMLPIKMSMSAANKCSKHSFSYLSERGGRDERERSGTDEALGCTFERSASSLHPVPLSIDSVHEGQ